MDSIIHKLVNMLYVAKETIYRSITKRNMQHYVNIETNDITLLLFLQEKTTYKTFRHIILSEAICYMHSLTWQ